MKKTETVKSNVASCEDTTKKPALNKRNASCIRLRQATTKTQGLNGEGWSQCGCPNGTVGNTHRICAPDEKNCNSCGQDYWMRIGEYSYFDELYRNEHPKEDSSIECVNLDVDPNAGMGRASKNAGSTKIATRCGRTMPITRPLPEDAA